MSREQKKTVRKCKLVKEWDMWTKNKTTDKEPSISISIRHNTNSIPHAKKVVTKEKVIWFDWNDIPTVIFSKHGFTVSEVITAIQEIITQKYETELGNILKDDDEIGSIDTLYYNPVTRYVSISVTFD